MSLTPLGVQNNLYPLGICPSGVLALLVLAKFPPFIQVLDAEPLLAVFDGEPSTAVIDGEPRLLIGNLEAAIRVVDGEPLVSAEDY